MPGSKSAAPETSGTIKNKGLDPLSLELSYHRSLADYLPRRNVNIRQYNIAVASSDRYGERQQAAEVVHKYLVDWYGDKKGRPSWIGDAWSGPQSPWLVPMVYTFLETVHQ